MHLLSIFFHWLMVTLTKSQTNITQKEPQVFRFSSLLQTWRHVASWRATNTKACRNVSLQARLQNNQSATPHRTTEKMYLVYLQRYKRYTNFEQRSQQQRREGSLQSLYIYRLAEPWAAEMFVSR